MIEVGFVHAGAELYGSDRVLLDLVSRLDPARFRARVVLSEQGPLVARLRQAGAEVCVTSVLGIRRVERARPLRWLRGAAPALRELGAVLDGVDLVHSTTLAAVGGALWARRRGVPHLWQVQEVPSRVAARALAPLVAATSRAVTCASAAVRAALVRAWPGLSDRVCVVYPGVELPALTPGLRESERARRGLGEDELLLSLIGRVSPRKGGLLALEAFERSGLSRARLWIVGGPAPGHAGYAARLRARVARSPRWREVVQLGFLAEVAPIHAASDVVLVPSLLEEGFGLVAAEALAACRPVLATDRGGLAEVVRHERSGLLLPPDPRVWAIALRRVARDPALRGRWGRAGRCDVAERFSPERALAAHSELYERLVGGGPPSPAETNSNRT